MKKAFFILTLLATAGCNSATAPQTAISTPAAATTPLQQAVTAYIHANKASFVDYEPVSWSAPVAYTKMSEAAIKGMAAMKVFDDALIPRNKALADYKASLSRKDSPAKTEAIKARYGKANKYNDSLLLIANSFIKVKDTTRLGTEIVHTYRARNNSGSVALDSTAFIVYKTGKVEQL
jgi:hypothetical protein